MLKPHGSPATIAMISGSLSITIQHANPHSLLYEKSGWTSVRGQLASTFDVRFPAWMAYLWCHIYMHIPHHISPVIPWYYLKEVSQCIQAAYAGYYQEQNFSLMHLIWFYRTPFLKQVDGKGYYILESLQKQKG
jgi:omega-6 fatty acid desaturase (delta-12 desaturase)